MSTNRCSFKASFAIHYLHFPRFLGKLLSASTASNFKYPIHAFTFISLGLVSMNKYSGSCYWNVGDTNTDNFASRLLPYFISGWTTEGTSKCDAVVQCTTVKRHRWKLAWCFRNHFIWGLPVSLTCTCTQDDHQPVQNTFLLACTLRGFLSSGAP